MLSLSCRCQHRQPLAWAFLAVATLCASASAAETHVLTAPVRDGEPCRVTVQLEVGGNLKVVDQNKVKALPMSVLAHLTYDEQRRATENGHSSSLRHYERAEATIKIEKGGAKPSLRASRRLIGSDWGASGVTLFSPQGPLTREELDLLSLPADSLVIDGLLPTEPVEVGATWKHSDALLAVLLDLDAVSSSEVSSTLKAATAGRTATVELAGKLEGALHGVSTKIELKGRYTYDFSQQRITHFVLLANEDRSIGHVATGVDVTSKVTLSVAPLTQSNHLNKDLVARTEFVADPASNPLAYESTQGFRLFLDRRWHAVTDDPKLLTLRFIDRGDLLAQCNIAPLEKAEPGKHVSLEKFQADIREALKDNFGQFVRASSGKDSDGRTIHKVIANGKVSELLIEWHYYLIADSEGRQVAFAFTLEEGLVERFGDTDRLLVGMVELFAPQVETAQPTPADKRKL